MDEAPETPQVPVVKRIGYQKATDTDCPGCNVMVPWADEPESPTESTAPLHEAPCRRCNALVEACEDCEWRGGHGKGRPCDQCGGQVMRRRCRMWPMRGGFVCRTHGGKFPAVLAKAAVNLEMERALTKLGALVEHFTNENPESDPLVGIIEVIERSSATMRAYYELVAELDDPTVSGGPTGRKAHPLVGLYQSSLTEHARICKLALDAGVAQRQIALAEAQSERMAKAFTTFLAEVCEWQRVNWNIAPADLARFRQDVAPGLLRKAIGRT
jgi:hypothetical protein